MLSTRESIKDLFQNLPERRDRRAYTRSNSPLVTYIDLGNGNGGIALNISEGGLAIISDVGLLKRLYAQGTTPKPIPSGLHDEYRWASAADTAR